MTWFATQVDVSREVNDGRGPVDFKISKGTEKTLVEFKLAKNTQMKRNLQKQTEIYAKASDAAGSIKVIVYFTAEEHKRVWAILRALKMETAANIVLVDARMDNKPSGSKAA
jgi:ribosome-binding ATPase YchF (GTP1/OBG family)